MSDIPLHFQSISELSQAIHGGALSPVELTRHFLARIEELDGALHAYLRVLPERALGAAEAAQTALRAGQDLGPLHGIPFAVKDLFDAKGVPTTAGSPLLHDNVAAADAAATLRLARAGMVLLGKTHTVQFAYGGAGVNHHHGTPHNPWLARHHVPGGSSSGSGVAVGAGLAPVALGTDTGGSVRIPAGLNGVTGLKTTVGRISRAGVFPLSHSLDSVGPLCRSAEDAALLLQALQGPDERDASTRHVPPVDALRGLRDGVRGMHVAFAETALWDDVEPDVAARVRDTGKVFESLGAKVGSVPFKVAAAAQELNRRGNVIAAEAYAVHEERITRHGDQYDPIVAARILGGKDVTAADYIRNTQAWATLREEALDALRNVEVLLCPTTVIPAKPLDEVDASLEAYVTPNLKYVRNTAVGNILNLCALSVPCGFTAGGLPVGLMMYGKPFDEATLLRAGYAFQQATDWHRRWPDLSWVAKAQGRARDK
ncbi:MAG: amidase [Candidatus Lambdaproteobacteria bacterium]|nr:amidase [Candidatus Lambdaproteobacteria bacterium]